MKKKYNVTHDQSISVTPLLSLETELWVKAFEACTAFILQEKQKIKQTNNKKPLTNKTTTKKAQAIHNIMLQGHAMTLVT